MKFFKVILSVILAASLAASMAACGKKTETDDSTEPSGNDTESQTQTDVTPDTETRQEDTDTQKDTESDTVTETDPATEPDTDPVIDPEPEPEDDEYIAVGNTEAENMMESIFQAIASAEKKQTVSLMKVWLEGQPVVLRRTSVHYDGSDSYAVVTANNRTTYSTISGNSYYLTDGCTYYYSLTLTDEQKADRTPTFTVSNSLDDYAGLTGTLRTSDNSIVLKTSDMSDRVMNYLISAISEAVGEELTAGQISFTENQAGLYLDDSRTLSTIAYVLDFTVTKTDGTRVSGVLNNSIIYSFAESDVAAPDNADKYTQISYQYLVDQETELDAEKAIDLGLWPEQTSFILDSSNPDILEEQLNFLGENASDYAGKEFVISGTIQNDAEDPHKAVLKNGDAEIQLYFPTGVERPADGAYVSVTTNLTPSDEVTGETGYYLYLVSSCQSETVPDGMTFEPAADRIYLIAPEVNVYRTPDGSVAKTCGWGTEFYRTGYNDEWYRVMDADDNIYYILASQCALMENEKVFAESMTMYVTSSALWIHSTPDFETESRVQIRLVHGDAVLVLAENTNGMYRIVYGDNQTGYISKKYVSRTQPD